MGFFFYGAPVVKIWPRHIFFAVRVRPYYLKSTGIHPNSEVKPDKAGLVLRWGTAWETPVLYTFFGFVHWLQRVYVFSGTQVAWRIEATFNNACLRPYHVECTGTRPISEVKQRRAWVVLRWVTTREVQVLLAF